MHAAAISNSAPSLRTAASKALDPTVAVAELASVLQPEQADCVIFFCSPDYDLHALGSALTHRFAASKIIGCTTAGEISGRGMTEGSISAIAFDRGHFVSELLLLDDLAFTDEATAQTLINDGLGALKAHALAPVHGNSFAFSLLDGLSIREEIMLPVMHQALNGVPLIGGSAGDGTNFKSTHVYFNGSFRENAAVVAIINTVCPFKILSSHHFQPTSEKLVVTRADPDKRVVLEFNAEPAAPEYCRVMGISLDDLSDATFACHPLGVQLGEHLYTRSIRQVNDDLSLTFFCAIDTGIILTKLEDGGLLEHFKAQMRIVNDAIGEPQAFIACDCIHRCHEAHEKGLRPSLDALYRRFNVVGFNTYGEQRDGLHLNHSFTGIAIGTPRA